MPTAGMAPAAATERNQAGAEEVPSPDDCDLEFLDALLRDPEVREGFRKLRESLEES